MSRLEERLRAAAVTTTEYLRRAQVRVPSEVPSGGLLDIEAVPGLASSRIRFVNRGGFPSPIGRERVTPLRAPSGTRRFWRIDPFPKAPRGRQAAAARQVPGVVARFRSSVWPVLRQAVASGWDTESRALFLDLWTLWRRPERNFGGGFVFESVSGCLTCVDHGGFLDDNPNTETLSLSPRVMTNYYAEGFAAYAFLRMAEHGDSSAWRLSALEALRFLIRTYEGYPRGAVWDHHEFKNVAFLECLHLLCGARAPEVGELARLLPRLRIDRYDPTNVLALRLHWKLAAARAGARKDSRRIADCVRRLRESSTHEGLIRDDYAPVYPVALDLTYHQFSLACLAGALAVEEDAEIRALFLRGCEFTVQTALSTGEVSYNGRGANNHYHLAAAIYALSVAHVRYGLSIPDLGPTLDLLERWRLPDGSLPTALNGHSPARMAWNHCRTPYNALTAYLLFRAADVLAGAKVVTPAPFESVDTPASGYFVRRSAAFELVFFNGRSESYAYSGLHRTGIAGLAALVPRNAESLLLVLGRVDSLEPVLVTDLPTLELDGKSWDPLGGEVETSENEVRWKLQNRFFSLVRVYRLEADRLTIGTRLTWRIEGEARAERWAGLPIATEAWRVEKVLEGVWEFESGGVQIRLSVVDPEVASQQWVSRAVDSNPRGPGVLLGFNRVGRVTGGEQWQSELRLELTRPREALRRRGRREDQALGDQGREESVQPSERWTERQG